MDKPIVTPWYLDKAFYAKLLLPAVSMVLAWANSKFPVPVSAETLDTIIAGYAVTTAVYIASHKWKTGILQKAQIAASSALAAVAGDDPAIGLAEAPRP